MSIISTSTVAYPLLSILPPNRTPVLDQAIQNADTDQDGALDRVELETALETILPGAQAAIAADQIMHIFDQNGDGRLTQQEMSERILRLSEHPDEDFSITIASPAEIGSRKVKAYDPADTNQDGRVTLDELITYQQAENVVLIAKANEHPDGKNRTDKDDDPHLNTREVVLSTVALDEERRKQLKRLSITV